MDDYETETYEIGFNCEFGREGDRVVVNHETGKWVNLELGWEGYEIDLDYLTPLGTADYVKNHVYVDGVGWVPNRTYKMAIRG